METFVADILLENRQGTQDMPKELIARRLVVVRFVMGRFGIDIFRVFGALNDEWSSPGRWSAARSASRTPQRGSKPATTT
jgi:hypothetical protein